MTDKIKVFVRLRPRITEGAQDVTNGYDDVLRYSEHRVCPLLGKEAERGKDGYVFQKVFSPTCTNEEVFDEVKEVTAAALDGISGTILAYGQTATGKTHTMRGSTNDSGVTERIVNCLFSEIPKRADWSFTVEVAYFEIHNEKVYDLISGSGKDLDLRVDNVQGLQYDKVSTADEAKASLDCGEANRKKSKTDLNEYSSRSHTVFKIQITGVSGAKRRKSTLHLVDLAGSENAKAAGYSDDSTQREGGAINKSLLALTSVIKGLADKNAHINYRDSKITRILQNSLGGNARTYIICCITAAKKYFAETMSTIHFADRARVVYNAVKVNEVDGTKSVPWDSYNKVVTMYREDLDLAAAREQKLRKQMVSECAAVLRLAHEEMAKTEELYHEMDYQNQMALQNIAAVHEKRLKQSKSEKQQLQDELNTLKKQEEELRSRVELSESAMKAEGEKLVEIKALKDKIAAKEKEVSELSKDNERLAGEVRAKDCDMEKTTACLEETEEKVKSMQSKDTEMQEENNKMKEAISSALTEVKAMTKEAKSGGPSIKCSPLKDLSNDVLKKVEEMKKAPLLSQILKDQVWPATARHVSPTRSPAANKKSQAPPGKKRKSPSKSPVRTPTPMSKLSSLLSPQKPPPKKTKAKRAKA